MEGEEGGGSALRKIIVAGELINRYVEERDIG